MPGQATNTCALVRWEEDPHKWDIVPVSDISDAPENTSDLLGVEVHVRFGEDFFKAQILEIGRWHLFFNHNFLLLI